MRELPTESSSDQSAFLSIFRSPCCHAHLEPGPWRCAACGRSFPSTLGIPDLRWPAARDDPVVTGLVRILLDRYPTTGFRDLVALEIAALTPPARLGEIYLDYRVNGLERGQRIERMFRASLSDHFSLPGRGLALDVGCGIGANMASIARDFGRVLGIDPYLPDLILAHKFFQEQGVANVVLVQAMAQALPFADGVFDYTSAQNTIEHLFDVQEAFAEIRRTLRPGGCFCGDSRNRFDLLTPEPHVQLRWLGFLPRRLMPLCARLFRNMEYKTVRLLSLCELRHYLRGTFGEQHRVTFPAVSAYGQSRQWDGLLDLIERIPFLNAVVLFFFPSHLALAQAGGASGSFEAR